MAHKDTSPPEEFKEVASTINTFPAGNRLEDFDSNTAPTWLANPALVEFDPAQPPKTLVGLEYHLIGIKEHPALRAAFCMLVTERAKRIKHGERKIVVDLLFRKAFEKLLAMATLTCEGCGEIISLADFLASPFELTHDSDKCRSLRVRNNLISKRAELVEELKKVTVASISMLKSAENVAGMHPADENPQRDPALDHQREKLQKMIRKFDAAINMHTAGKYGTCADCDETIDPARLMVAPNTSQCVDCKTEKEEREKVPGKNGSRVPLKRLDIHRTQTSQ